MRVGGLFQRALWSHCAPCLRDYRPVRCWIITGRLAFSSASTSVALNLRDDAIIKEECEEGKTFQVQRFLLLF